MSWSRRATVLDDTAMPSGDSSSARVAVVRRDQRKPVMGSPAVSCSSRQWRTAIMSGVFFRRGTSPARAAGPAADHIPIQQLLTTAGDGMHVQAQEIAQQSVPAMAQANGLQPSKQPPLLFIEQAIEQKDGRLNFGGRSLEGGSMHGHRNGLSTASGQHLLAAWDGLDGGIEKLALDFDSCKALLRDEMAERLLHFGVQIIRQLLSIIALGRLVHKTFHGCQQGSVAGEPNPLVPPSAIVEVSDITEAEMKKHYKERGGQGVHPVVAQGQ
jgi:hypothetical protein